MARQMLTLRNMALSHRLCVSNFSTSGFQHDSYKLLIVGGGCGGSAIANKFANKLGHGRVAVVEPSKVKNCKHNTCILFPFSNAMRKGTVHSSAEGHGGSVTVYR